MNIKTYAKINIWITKTITFIMIMVLFFSIIMYPIVIFANPSTETFWFLISCIFYLAISGIVLDVINKHFNIIQRFLKIPNDKKFILSMVLTGKHSAHSSIQLNSELDKLSKAIENKSSFYLNPIDFPLLYKLFRRLEQAKAKQKQSDELKNSSINNGKYERRFN